jgi:hypothetical protein
MTQIVWSKSWLIQFKPAEPVFARYGEPYASTWAIPAPVSSIG